MSHYKVGLVYIYCRCPAFNWLGRRRHWVILLGNLSVMRDVFQLVLQVLKLTSLLVTWFLFCW